MYNIILHLVTTLNLNYFITNYSKAPASMHLLCILPFVLPTGPLNSSNCYQCQNSPPHTDAKASFSPQNCVTTKVVDVYCIASFLATRSNASILATTNTNDATTSSELEEKKITARPPPTYHPQHAASNARHRTAHIGAPPPHIPSQESTASGCFVSAHSCTISLLGGALPRPQFCPCNCPPSVRTENNTQKDCGKFAAASRSASIDLFAPSCLRKSIHSEPFS